MLKTLDFFFQLCLLSPHIGISSSILQWSILHFEDGTTGTHNSQRFRFASLLEWGPSPSARFTGIQWRNLINGRHAANRSIVYVTRKTLSSTVVRVCRATRENTSTYNTVLSISPIDYILTTADGNAFDLKRSKRDEWMISRASLWKYIVWLPDYHPYDSWQSSLWYNGWDITHNLHGDIWALRIS